ncbi:MAG: FtsH protease activity modulator HflK [Chloroflexi bacterium]|nr:FtsH protease activity modulator HflK [Chloroflexota bacterium]|tara:strand:- start:1659 stop:2654 length:996 start_codon:yes stop_codon:yes gene_type:complete
MFQNDGPRGPNIGDTIQNIGGASGNFRKIFRGGFRGILIIAFLILGGLWLSTGVYTVEAGEQAVVRQFGKFHSLADPGLNFRIPAPVQTITKVNVEAIRTTQIGFRSQDGQTLRVLDEALMLTTDNSIVEAQLVVQYKVSDPKDFVFNVLEPEEVLRTTSEVALRSVVGRTGLQYLLTVGRGEVELAVREFTENLLIGYGTGIQITDVKLLTVDPPEQVKDAFQEVVRALEDETRSINVAEAYKAGQLPIAKGQVQVQIRGSAAYYQEQVERSAGEAGRFLALLEQYRGAPQVTRERLYLESLEKVLNSVEKVIVDGNVDALPLLGLTGLD